MLVVTGKLFVVSAPSGAGKTTVVNKVIERIKSSVSISRVITYTTKAPRPGEVDGIDYHFLSPQQFEQKIAQSFFIEWSTWYGHYYGSPRSILDDIEQGHSYIMIVDLPGARSIKALYKDAVCVWIALKSLQQLEKRLVSRNTESEEQLEKRLSLAKKELEQQAQEQIFDYTIINDVLFDAVDNFEHIISSEINDGR